MARVRLAVHEPYWPNIAFDDQVDGAVEPYLDAYCKECGDPWPCRAFEVARFRELLLEAGERAHKNGCRPINGLDALFFNYDIRHCRNEECKAIVKALGLHF